jgi:hypothetical protein
VSESEVGFSRGLPATVLEAVPSTWAVELEDALRHGGERRRLAVSSVAAHHPQYLSAWASLAEIAEDPVASYAYARVGYHRGLDALRRAGWKGSGYVRWSEEPNRGFLRSLEALRAAAAAIGEDEEADRCEVLLGQLDPTWRPDRTGPR